MDSSNLLPIPSEDPFDVKIEEQQSESADQDQQVYRPTIRGSLRFDKEASDHYLQSTVHIRSEVGSFLA